MSIRVTASLRDDLAEASKLLNLSEHDTMRLAMQVGIKHFRAIDYDLAGAVISQSNLLQKPQPQAANSGPVKTAASPSNITPLPAQHTAADVAGNDDDIQARQKIVYSSGQKKKKG
jgi:hypothetical protein